MVAPDAMAPITRRILIVLALAVVGVWVYLLVTGPLGHRAGPGGSAPVARYDGNGKLLQPVPPPARRPNLIVLVIDSLRADVARGVPGEAPAMPYLGRLAKEGVAFEDASASAPWTEPSMGSFLTGLLPTANGNLDCRQPPSLPLAVATFAEVLWRSWGYEGVAFTGGTSLGGERDLLQGLRLASQDFHLQRVEELLGPWAAERDRTKPFFLFLHTYEAHDPYGERNHTWPWVPVPPEELHVPEGDLEPWFAARTILLERDLRLVLSQRYGTEFVDKATEYLNDLQSKSPHPGLVEELRPAYVGGCTWVDGLLERALASVSTGSSATVASSTTSSCACPS
jgi:hypothetical protein